jgi:hypothetical protein
MTRDLEWHENKALRRMEVAAPKMLKALHDVRREMWVDYCLGMGRTDCDPAPFNSGPKVRIIDAAIKAATGEA